MPKPTLPAVEKIYKTVPFEIKSINVERRTFTAVASDASVDRHGESINQDGWVLDNFLKNPVILLNHDYWGLPVAKALQIGFDTEERLVFELQFATAEEYDMADTVFRLYQGGYMRAFSVGFIPLDATWDKVNEVYTYTKMELLEISAVTVPSNPNALALAYKEGIIDENAKKQLIATHKSIIKSLTETVAQPQDNDNDEDELVSEELLKAINGLNDTVKALGDKVDALAAKKDVTDEDETPAADEDEQKPKTTEESGDKPSDEQNDGGAQGNDEEVSEEEAQKIIDEAVQAAINEAKGKVV